MEQEETKEEVKVETQELKEVSQEQIDKLIRNNVLVSMGFGLIPIPLVDFAAITGVQLNMIRILAKMYEVPFSKDKGKHIIASLIGGTIPASFGGILTSLVKVVPIIGQTTGALVMPVLAGGTTYAIGKVMVQHFASGGTFLNFNPEQVKEYYSDMLSKGKEVASKIKSGAMTQ
ncbi:MAG: DUF697 domain-containing protein [Desulfobacterales bacterium]|nr:DUF697 domain-containing protein [Desulfobacterales bacterium]